MNRYYYMDISLDLPDEKNSNVEVTAAYFKNHIVQSVKQLFGEVAASIDFDVLKYHPFSRRAILRVPADYYVKIRSSLTLAGSYGSSTCIFRVYKASPYLLHLVGDSRDFDKART